MRFLPAIFASLALLGTNVRAECYFPGGDYAADHRPCDKHAYTSLCCAQGYTCFDNHLCIVTETSDSFPGLKLGAASRGTCTNPKGNDTACGDFCLNNPVSDNDGTLSSCGNNQWCCGPDVTSGNCSCQSGEGTFKVSDGHAFAIIGEDGAQDGAPQETNTDTVPTATSVSAQAKSSASSSTKSTSSTSTSSASSSATPPPKKDINTAVVAGTSTAVGVAALLIIALLIVLFRVRRHKKRRDSRTNTTVTGMSTPARVRTVAQPTRPPSPNPYDNVTHATMPPNQDGIAQANRSQFNGFIIPDGDTEDRRQGEMRGPPAVDPYDVPEVPDHLFGNRERYGIGVGAGGGFGDGVESRAPPPPSYRTNAASPPPQRRNVLRRQRSRISEGSRLSTA